MTGGRGLPGEPRRLSATEWRLPDAARWLTEAYQAVIEHPDLDDRLAEIERRAALLVGAQRAFVQPTDQDVQEAPGSISVVIPGGFGVLHVVPAEGHPFEPADRSLLEQFALLVSGPVNDARLLRLTAGLHRVGSLLDSAVDPEGVVAEFLTNGLPLVGAQFGVVALRDADTLRVVGARSRGRFAVDDRIPLDSDRPLARSARTGKSVFQRDLEEVRSGVGRDGPVPEPSEQAWAAVPLESGSGRIGALGMRFESRQRFDAAQRTFLVEVGARLGAALERSATFQNERRARMEAEQAAARVQVMRDLAATLAGAATRKDVAEALLGAVMTTSRASIGLVATYRQQRRRIELLASDPPGHELYLPPFDVRRVIDAVLESGQALEMRGIDEVQALLHTDLVAREFGADSLAFYPIIFRRRQVGVVLLGWVDGTAIDAFDRDVLDTQILMAGPALQRATNYEREHDIADTLQRSLLSVPRFEMREVRWSSHYRTGSSGLAGGDWYDVIPIDDHHVGFAIGDIVGRGVQAAATMGQLRSATRALALGTLDPEVVLSSLDDFAAATGAGLYSTVALIVLDRRDGTARSAIAGHPPPILRRSDGSTAVLEGGRGPLLGRAATRTAATVRIPRGATVAMYTDGLVERRGEPLDEAIERAARSFAEEGHSGGRGRLARRLVDRLTDDGQAEDDVAVLTFTYLG